MHVRYTGRTLEYLFTSICVVVVVVVVFFVVVIIVVSRE